MTEETEKYLRDFISTFKWIYAKTYAATAPHEYIVLEYVDPKYKVDFIRFAEIIRSDGFKAMYYSWEGHYLVIDDYYYWTMDENIRDTDLINRALLSEYELINNSWFWKGKEYRE